MRSRWIASLTLSVVLAAVTVPLLELPSGQSNGSHVTVQRTKTAAVSWVGLTQRLVTPTTTTTIALPPTTTTTEIVESQQVAVVPAVVTTAPPVTSPPAPVSVPTTTSSGNTDATSTTTPDWNCIKDHESGDTYGESNGGAFQFLDSTWEAITGKPGPAEDYPATTQNAAALALYNYSLIHYGSGFEQWSTAGICGV